MDTVYGPKTLFGSWVEEQAEGVVQEFSVEEHQAEIRVQTERNQRRSDARRDPYSRLTLLGKDRWLLRAGLYWMLASSPWPKLLVTDAKNTFFQGSVMVTVAEIPGDVLFWAGVLSVLAQGMLVLLPDCLVTPWAKSLKDVPSPEDEGTAEETTKQSPPTNSEHVFGRFSFAIRACQKVTAILLTLLFCSLHVVRIMCLTSSTPSAPGEILYDSGMGRSDVKRESASSETSLSTHHAFLPAVSALTLCVLLLLWSLVYLVKSWHEDGKRECSPGWSWTLLYVCSATTLLTQEVVDAVVEVADGFGRAKLDESVSEKFGNVAKMCVIASSLTAVLLPVCFSLFTNRRILRSSILKLSSLTSSASWLSKDVVFRLAHALAVALSLCSLGLALLAAPLPWLSVRTSYSRDFQPLVDALRNVSLQMTRHAVALDSLLTFPVCQEEEMSVLADDVSHSHKLLSRISVDQIENFCLEFECQEDLNSPPRSKSSRHNHHHQPSHAGAAFCNRFCHTLAFFRGTVAFDASVHQTLAKEVKGNSMYEVLHLKSLILEEKNRFISDLENQATLGQFLQAKDGSYDRMTSRSKEKAQGDVSQQNDVFDSLGHQYHQQETSEQTHSSCMQTLCALRAVSSAGLAAPLLGFAFQAMHVAVQAMLLLLELVMRAQEFKIVFQDFRLRLDALALYLEHGVEERVVYLSIYNYSLIYLAYPALLTGCIGMLAGFWQRRGAALSHRYRITLAVVLPLMLLNLCGIGMTVAWTQIVESLSSLVTLVDVTSSPEAGARALLAAFTCGACSCVMFLALARWHTRHIRVTDALEVPDARHNASTAGCGVCLSRDSSCSQWRSTTPRLTLDGRSSPVRVQLGCAGRQGVRSNDNRKKFVTFVKRLIKHRRRWCTASQDEHAHPTECRDSKSGSQKRKPSVRGENNTAKGSCIQPDLDPRSPACPEHDKSCTERATVAQDTCPVQQRSVLRANESVGDTCCDVASKREKPTTLCRTGSCAEDETFKTDTEEVTARGSFSKGKTSVSLCMGVPNAGQAVFNKMDQAGPRSNAPAKRNSTAASDEAGTFSATTDQAYEIPNSASSSGYALKDITSPTITRSGGTSDTQATEPDKSQDAHCCFGVRRRLLFPTPCCAVAGGGSWVLVVVLVCSGCLLMLLCLRVPAFTAHVDLRREFEALLTQLGQGGSAVEVGRRVLLARDQGSCDVIQLVGREVLSHYISTLEGISVDSLLIELHGLKIKAKTSMAAVLPLITVPCIVTSLVSCGLVLYGALSARCLHQSSGWTLSSKGAAQALHRLTLLSLAWLLHASLAMAGPASGAAVPVVVEMHVQLGTGFVFALAAHLVLLLGSFELRLSSVSPLAGIDRSTQSYTHSLVPS